MDLTSFEKSPFKGRMEEFHRKAMALRSDKDKPVDISFNDMSKEFFQISAPELLISLGIDPHFDTIHNISHNTGDLDVRWIIPEIYREALMLGYREGPIWPNIIASEEKTAGLNQIIPFINMSDAAPRKVGEAETIPLGQLSYGQKAFTIFKVGRGISISYEVIQYASLNVVRIFLADFGTKLGHAFDTLALDTLINGDQANGSESAPVLGIANPNTKKYRDLLRVWVRMGRIGRSPSILIGGETTALDTLDLDEFKKKESGTTHARLNVKTPMPSGADYYIHGMMDDNQELILDPKKALIKFNAQPLLVESEKIVSNQTQAFYASITSGFAKMFRDAAIILDSSLDIDNAGFPSYMDIDPYMLVSIE